MKLENLTWETTREALQNKPIGLIPIGAVENHGPHLPLATDWIAATAIAEAAASRDGIMVLPGCSVGVSEHHRQFWGTIWIEPDLLRGLAVGIARAAASHGMDRLVFVNGHGGNTATLDQATRILRKEGIHAFVFEYWHAIHELIERTCQLPEDHAGDMETSVVLAVDPSLVYRERFAQAAAQGVVSWGRQVHGVQLPLDTVEFTRSGTVGDPSRASAEKGRLLIDASAEELVKFCTWLSARDEAELASSGRPAPLPR